MIRPERLPPSSLPLASSAPFAGMVTTQVFEDSVFAFRILLHGFTQCSRVGEGGLLPEALKC